jgi:hypothetical protein
VQVDDHPPKLELAAGIAVSVTVDPNGKCPAQAAVKPVLGSQLITVTPGFALSKPVTLPAPSPTS